LEVYEATPNALAQLDDDDRVWDMHCRAQLIKEKIWAAVVTDHPASASASKGYLVADAWDRVGVGDYTDVGQADSSPFGDGSQYGQGRVGSAQAHIFERRDNAWLLQLMHELSNLNNGGDKAIIEYRSRAKGQRHELAMLGNQVDENTLVMQILSDLPAECPMVNTVLENMDGKRNLGAGLWRDQSYGRRGPRHHRQCIGERGQGHSG